MRLKLSGVGLVTGFGAGVATTWRQLLAGRTLPVCPRADESAGVRYDSPKSDLGTMLDLALCEALAAAELPEIPAYALLVQVVPPTRPPSSAECGQIAATVGPFPWHHPCSQDGADSAFQFSSCNSAAVAIAFARDRLCAGLAEVAVIASASLVNRYEYLNMVITQALADGPAHPFDRARSGTALGDGACVVILETEDHAARRGHLADIEVSSVVTQVSPDRASACCPEMIFEPVLRSVRQAGVVETPYVHADATGAVRGDLAEIKGLDWVAEYMGWHRMPVSSHKGALGHLLHASTFAGIAVAAMALRHGLAPGTSGLVNPEPTCGIQLLRRSAPLPHKTSSAVVNSLESNGNHVVVVLKRNEPRTI